MPGCADFMAPMVPGPAPSTDHGEVLTLHTADVVLPMTGEAIPDGAVLVDGATVAAVGHASRCSRDNPGVRVRAHRGILTPGLVNAHAHLQYTDFNDLASTGKPFPEWIAMVAARRSTFDDAAWQSSARRGIHLAIRSGTTAVADIVTDPAVLPTLARSAASPGRPTSRALFLDAPGWEQRAAVLRRPARLARRPQRGRRVAAHALHHRHERLLGPAGAGQVARDAHAHAPRRVDGRVGVRAHRHRPVRRLRPPLRHGASS